MNGFPAERTSLASPELSRAVADWPSVSVVMPVRNESAHLRAAVGGVLAQDYLGEIELVIALGPSRDGTEAIIAELVESDPRLRIVSNPSGRTPCALNAAIAVCQHQIIVRTDAHGVLPTDYVRVAVELLTSTGAANVGGVMHAEGVTPFEKAVACAMTSPLGVGNARFHVGGQPGPADTVYLGVFRRDALNALGGYDESFERAQDWELNFRIRSAGGLVWFSPKLRVSYRPRPSIRALAAQYFHYGRWRRVLTRYHRGSVNPRYLTPPATLMAIMVGCLVGLSVHPVGWIAPVGYLSALLTGSAIIGRRLEWPASLWLVLVLAVMHLSWAVGFLTSPSRLVPRRQTR
jgi:glycosyltransferase involved in cell wall biosynthesis